GMHTVTLRVTQDDGQQVCCTATVTISEPAPTAICQNVTKTLATASATVLATEVNNGSDRRSVGSARSLEIGEAENTATGGSDCTTLEGFAASVRYGCADAAAGGMHIVTLRVTQDDGQQVCCAATVTISEPAPTAICQDVTKTLATASATVLATEVNNG